MTAAFPLTLVAVGIVVPLPVLLLRGRRPSRRRPAPAEAVPVVPPPN